MQNISADAYIEPFPHLVFHNFYTDEELDLIWEELKFYTKPNKLFDVEELGAVIGGSVMLNYSGIEAGVLVVKPDINTYNNIIDALKSDTYDIKMSDQSFLNDYF